MHIFIRWCTFIINGVAVIVYLPLDLIWQYFGGAFLQRLRALDVS